jgi:hypothetical protein
VREQEACSNQTLAEKNMFNLTETSKDDTLARGFMQIIFKSWLIEASSSA